MCFPILHPLHSGTCRPKHRSSARGEEDLAGAAPAACPAAAFANFLLTQPQEDPGKAPTVTAPARGKVICISRVFVPAIQEARHLRFSGDVTRQDACGACILRRPDGTRTARLLQADAEALRPPRGKRTPYAALLHSPVTPPAPLHHARHSAPLCTPHYCPFSPAPPARVTAGPPTPHAGPLPSTPLTPTPHPSRPHSDARDPATRPAQHTPVRYPALPSAPRVAPPQTGCLSLPATTRTRSVSREYSTFTAVTHSTTASTDAAAASTALHRPPPPLPPSPSMSPTAPSTLPSHAGGD